MNSDPTLRENDRQELERVLRSAELDPALVDAGLASGAGIDIAGIVDELTAQARCLGRIVPAF